MALSLNPIDIVRLIREWDGKKKDNLLEYLSGGLKDAQELERIWIDSYDSLLAHLGSVAAQLADVKHLSSKSLHTHEHPRTTEFYDLDFHTGGPGRNIGPYWKLKAHYKDASGTLGTAGTNDLRDKYVMILGEILLIRDQHAALHATASDTIKRLDLVSTPDPSRAAYDQMNSLRSSLARLVERVADLDYLVRKYRLTG